MDLQREGDPEVAREAEGFEVEFDGNFKSVEDAEGRSHDGRLGSVSSESARRAPR